MARFRIVHCIILSLTAGLIITPVMATPQDPGPSGIGFDGAAQTGTDNRPVRFRFFCSSNDGRNVTGVLAVELEIPKYDQLRSIFDFDPFEGPDAKTGKLTLLRTGGVRSTADASFAAAGSILAAGLAAGSSEAFMLEVSASRREAAPLRKLATVLRPLLDGPSTLTWRQNSAKPNGIPISASLELTQPQAVQLKNELHSCLEGR